MNIWDSVHRGLEKASQEAARISKAQKLRSQIDTLSRQLNAQNTTLLSRTMELFNTNQLTQSQLLPLCQEMVNLQQQLESAQNELKLLHSQGVPSTPPTENTTGTYQLTSPYAGGETLYAPPPPGSEYQAQTIQAPPPPGSAPQTVSAMETLLMGNNPTPPPPPALPGSIRCIGCQGEIASGLSYCPNCGRPAQESTIAHLPTMRGGTLEPFYPPGQETIRSQTSSEQKTPVVDQETARSEGPPFGNQPKKKDGGL